MTSESGWIVGGCFFLAMGTLNILFYRKTGQDFFAKTQSGRPFVANFWAPEKRESSFCFSDSESFSLSQVAF
ncbi:MAG: hypothetical protein DMG78_18995 [Acidobacteria bacterium]|nr:MAG: hypothetical protein DMG78_18995 [Acidobacteriota bacterium]